MQIVLLWIVFTSIYIISQNSEDILSINQNDRNNQTSVNLIEESSIYEFLAIECSCNLMEGIYEIFCCCDKEDCASSIINVWKNNNECIDEENVIPANSNKCINQSLITYFNKNRGLNSNNNSITNKKCFSYEDKDSEISMIDNIDKIQNENSKFNLNSKIKERVNNLVKQQNNEVNPSQYDYIEVTGGLDSDFVPKKFFSIIYKEKNRRTV